MDGRHRKVLQKCWKELRRDLEPKKLFPYLTEVLDNSDIEDLNARSTREGCVDALLEKLPRKGPQAFGIFVKALQETQSHLATTLQCAGRNFMVALYYCKISTGEGLLSPVKLWMDIIFTSLGRYE